MLMRFGSLWLLALLLFTQCAPMPQAAGQFTDQEFEAMATRMAEGEVADMSVDSLQAIMENVVLLDAREKPEYDISHLPGAQWVGYDDFDLARVADLSKETPIVLYCSVGYRSERIGEKLLKAGFTDVKNLKGSLFAWVNAGYAVVSAKDEPTQQVHGYNKDWSKWLRQGEVVY